MLTGAILAGGENRRMNGRVKALLPFSGELLIERQIRQMQLICDEIIIVTNEPELYVSLLAPVIKLVADIYPRKGPLSGMHAALSGSQNTDVWIVACDMPFISAQAAKLMQEVKSEKKVSAAIPANEDRKHPLHGIYDKTCIEPISDLLNTGDYRVMELFSRINWKEASNTFFTEKGIDFLFTTNVNTPEDYAQALAQG